MPVEIVDSGDAAPLADAVDRVLAA